MITTEFGTPFDVETFRKAIKEDKSVEYLVGPVDLSHLRDIDLMNEKYVDDIVEHGWSLEDVSYQLVANEGRVFVKVYVARCGNWLDEMSAEED